MTDRSFKPDPEMTDPEPPEGSFGEVGDLDFGSPALDSDVESFFSAGGFAARVEATQDDRLAPGHLFAQRPDSAPPAASPVPAPSPPSIAPVPATPVVLVPGPAPVVAPIPVPASATTPDALVFGPGTPERGTTLPKRRRARFRVGKKTLVGITAVALVCGAAAFGAYRLGLFGAVGTQPEAVIPSTAFAYAKIDLNPSLTQKVNAYRFMDKLPSVDVSDPGDVKREVLTAFLDGNTSGLTYERDFASWMGDRAAFAALPAPGTADGLTPLLVVQYTDEDAMTAALTRIDATAELYPNASDQPTEAVDLAWAVRGDYVLISDDQAEVNTAAAAQQTLTDNARYAQDMAAVGPDQIAAAWIDLPTAWANLPADDRADWDGLFAEDITGSIAVGVHASSEHLEATGHAFDLNLPGPTQPATNPGTGLIETLPADTTVAFAATNLGPAIAQGWAQYRNLDVFGLSDTASTNGVDFPADLAAAFGTEFAAAVKMDPSGGDAVVSATTPDPAVSVAAVRKIARYGVPELQVTPTSTGYLAATNAAWAEPAADPTRALGQDPDFTAAVPGAATANLVAFVRIADLASAFEDT